MQPSTNNLEALPAPCQRALEVHTRQLLNEAVDAAECSFSASHLAQCAACRALFSELSSTHQVLNAQAMAGAASPGFAARTMARITVARAPEKPNIQAPKVWVAPRTGVRFRKVALIAAMVMLAVAAVIAGVWVSRKSGPGLSIKRGEIVDAAGNVEGKLQPGHDYIVRQQTVLDLSDAVHVKAEAGAQFRLRDNGTALPDIELRSGDLYARADDAAAPLELSCKFFDASVNSGDVFVAHEDAEVSRGIVIVFAGSAQVTSRNQTTVQLDEGHVFYSVGSESWSSADRIELRDVPRLQQKYAADSQPAAQPAELRAQYAEKVAGYRSEMDNMRRKLASLTPASPEHSEVAERLQRVEKYLQVHQQRLQALTSAGEIAPPFDQIQRGIDGHANAKDWL
jgi:hypothetical protein